MEFKKFQIESKLGTLELVVTEGTHIHVNAVNDIIVNNVQYTLGCHMHLWNDGQWHVGQQFKQDGTQMADWERALEALYMTKRKARNYNDYAPSESAKRKVLELLPEVVNTWAKDNCLPLQQAEVEKLADSIEKLQAEIDGHLAAVKKLQAKRDGLQALHNAKAAALNTAVVA